MNTKTIEKINKQIDSLNSKIEKLSGNYQTNTWKRMREQDSRDTKIRGYKFDLDIMKYLLNVCQDRELTVVENALLVSTFRTEIHSYKSSYDRYKNNCSHALEIKYPEASSNCAEWYNETIPKKQKMLSKANIFNTEDLVNAVKEYSIIVNAAKTPIDHKAERIKKLERELKMQQKGDINFTPKEVVERLIQMAHINENSLILEPSAGIGNIADEIKKVADNVDVVEYRSDFRELLELKGLNIVGEDFLEYQTDKQYDAIIANPPFSDEQNHVMKMYELLKNGGTLVTITSPHWTFANDRKSVEFREWVESLDYSIENLDSGTFEMTGVASRILVINK